MSEHSQFTLLGKRRFGPFFATQALGAFNDNAFRQGMVVYWAAITEPDALSAIKLTLLAAAIALPLNAIFGIAAAWAITKFDFRGKSMLLTLIDLPPPPRFMREGR